MIATHIVLDGCTQHQHSRGPVWMSNANRKGSTPSPPSYQQRIQLEEATTEQQHRAAMMASYSQSGNLSVPIHAAEEERIQIAGGSGVNVNDVLCGRGKVSFNHPGNKRFRESITKSLDDWRKAVTRTDKSSIVQRIMDEISNSGGRFLKKNNSTGEWYQLNDQQTKEKVSHAVRDAANTMDSRKGQGKAKAKLKSVMDKPDSRLSLGLGSMPSFPSSGSMLGSSNFYENLDRATREIRRHASQQRHSWTGGDRSYDTSGLLGGGMGNIAGERLPIPAVRDIQIPGEQQHPVRSEHVARAPVGQFQSMQGRMMGVGLDRSIHTNSLSEPSIAGLHLHHAGHGRGAMMMPEGPRIENAGHGRGAIMMPEGPRIGFGNLPRDAPPNISNRGVLPPAPAMPPQPPQQMIHQQHSSEDENHFLDMINDVLGPSEEDDQMGGYLDPRVHPRR